MQTKGYFLSWFDTEISCKDLALVYLRWICNKLIGGQVFMSDKWEVHSYTIMLFLWKWVQQEHIRIRQIYLRRLNLATTCKGDMSLLYMSLPLIYLI